MYLINRSRGELQFSTFGDFKKRSLDVNCGIKVNEDNSDEVAYYKLFASAGAILVPDETYTQLTGIKVETKPVVEAKKEYTAPTVTQVEEKKLPAEVVKELKEVKKEEPKKEEPKKEEPKTKKANA